MIEIASIAASSAPAGGAETGQVIGATAAALLLTAGLIVFGLGHRAGRVAALGRLAGFSERLSGLPGWAALPSAVATGSLLAAVFGLYWDVSLHIDNGRDPGPLANPSHYFILFGLFGIFTAGWISMSLPAGRPGPAAIRLRGDWEVPVSGILLMATAAFALGGFPLDDISHRLFGQDVTLWGPTHLMMLGGAAFSLIAILGLLVEGRLATRGVPERGGRRAPLDSGPMRTLRVVSAFGGLLIGLSIFQGEFDFGVPQFQLLYEPVLLAFAAAVPLVAARTVLGRGAALGVVGFFLVVRGGLTLLVGPILGETVAHFPLYIAEALLVELVALAVAPRRGLRFGVAAGAAIGTLGVLAEYGWSQAWMTFPWPADILPAAIALALPVAIAGGAIGSLLAAALRLEPAIAGGRRAAGVAAASLATLAAVLAFLLPTEVPRASVSASLTPVPGAGPRELQGTFRITPASAARGADWLNVTSWQGRERLRVDPLRRVSDGVYRTTAPIPASGSWKATLRLHRGRELSAIPVYMPADTAIPAAAVPAEPRFERRLVADRKLLQRERKRDVPSWLWVASGAVVLSAWIALLALLAWGLARIARRGGGAPPPPRPAAQQGRAVTPRRPVAAA